MTQKEIDQLNRIMQRANFSCEVCGEYIGHTGCRAHRISKSKMNYKKYGSDIIDHDYNICYTHMKCNDTVNIGNNNGKCKNLINLIKFDKIMGFNSRDVKDIEYCINEK